MITHLSASDLAVIARNGGGLALDASRHNADELADVARNMTPGAQLILRNTKHLSVSEMIQIAKNGSNTVLFAD